ncbi:MAG: response regulator [Alphaproteobacteria bacterium]|nr:response regulator [Alphaproteobacteria bacterium]MBV9419654.1 response regulator [Alphaproteobacteria bacterium]MBV9541386.1 response regulator [Alphaproteobacteria bacterium]MBV9905903.1 response regulator [Alphaproteobacteria bacterium]
MKNCLVVDDSRVIRKVACRILQDLQFWTEEAEDGLSALNACRSKMPELILLDWQMPNMNGIEFLRALRKEQGGLRPIVVFCTTENDVPHITEALNAGANEYIMKPFDRGIIEAKLAEVGMM